MDELSLKCDWIGEVSLKRLGLNGFFNLKDEYEQIVDL